MADKGSSHVSYQQKNKVRLSTFEHALAGGVSGFITRAVAQPLDVLKIRFQLQVEPTCGKRTGLYYGILQATAKIVNTEGLSGLWKGHVPAQFLTVAYGIGQFGSYAFLTRIASENGFGESNSIRGTCGGISGMIGTLLSMPCDVVRTRVVAQGHPKQYSGMFDACRQILKKEGPQSLWRGLTPTLLQNAPQTALQFYFYNAFMKFATSFCGEDGFLTASAISGTAAGAFAKACTYPLDTLKKRIQMRGFEDARSQFGRVVKYKSMLECIAKVTQEEGVIAWFKGLWPSLLKATVSSGLIFVSYEFTCIFLTKTYH
ncbi:unnamed protein product [Meganyctiphanes norvegica]|uniref:Mitochondrial thiamine pyrophosphate carrier n=1 Tax=Meganyctiphanes norvegica TaxID=48144 RepID=A0AAV2PPU7_MEGNR